MILVCMNAAGPVDRAIDVAFRRQMHHDIGPIIRKDALHFVGVGDVGAHERIARIVRDRRERSQIAGVGELVDHADAMVGFANEMADDGRSDEARAPGDEKSLRHQAAIITERGRKVSQARQLAILVGQHRIRGRNRPADRQRRIVPDQALLAVRRIIIVDLVGDFGVRFERAIAVREAARNKQLLAALRRQGRGHPAPVSRRADAQVHGDVIDAAAQHANELALHARRHLKVQRAHRSALERQRLIVLNEFGVQPGLVRRARIVGFDKESARVVKKTRRQQQDTRNVCGLHVHDVTMLCGPIGRRRGLYG